jgi:hypothetical protein
LQSDLRLLACLASTSAPLTSTLGYPYLRRYSYLLLVDAVVLLEKHCLSDADVTAVKNLIIRFSEYYERRFYQEKWDHLRVCLPTFHQLLHIHEALTAIGPMYVYWQWPMERLCGMITQTAKSKVAANQNMANVMVQDEQINHLPYVLPLIPDHELFTTENDGQVDLADMLINNLHAADGIGRPQASGYEFISPQHTHHFEPDEYEALSAYLEVGASTFQDETLQSDLHQFPTKAIRWAAVQFANFRVGASKMQKSNSTRSNSLIRYEYMDPDELCIVSAFGRVSLFFEVFEQPQERLGPEALDQCHAPPVTHHVALITQLTVAADGRLVKVVQEGQSRIINVLWIKEVMGLFLWEGDRYLLRRTTSLLL